MVTSPFQLEYIDCRATQNLIVDVGCRVRAPCISRTPPGRYWANLLPTSPDPAQWYRSSSGCLRRYTRRFPDKRLSHTVAATCASAVKTAKPAWARMIFSLGYLRAAGIQSAGNAKGTPGPVWTIAGTPSLWAVANTKSPSSDKGLTPWPMVCSLIPTNFRSLMQRSISRSYAS